MNIALRGLTGAAIIAVTTCAAQAATIVRWDFNDGNLAADEVATGVTLTDYDAAAGVNNFTAGNGTGGVWGDTWSFPTGGPAGASDKHVSKGSANQGRFMAFTLTNSGANNINLESFAFDSRDNFGGDSTYVLHYKLAAASTSDQTSGASQSTTVVTGSSRSITANNTWQSSSIDLTVLPSADRTLAPGETLSLFFVNSTANNPFHQDNFKLTGTIVPEPAAVSLLGLSALALVRRRRMA